MSVLEYLLLFLSVLAGGALIFVVNEARLRRWLPLVLAFGGAYILGISVTHIMPGIYATGERHIGLYVLGGFFLQLLLERLSQGVEHGHIHAQQGAAPSFALPIMLGLCIHALLEGLPLSGYALLEEGHQHTTHGATTNHLLYGIILHKLPASFALAALLRSSGYRPLTVGLCLLIFATMSPLGSLIGAVTGLAQDLLQPLMALVVGSFLHIATTILFEADNSRHHGVSGQKLGAILLGMGLALLTL